MSGVSPNVLFRVEVGVHYDAKVCYVINVSPLPVRHRKLLTKSCFRLILVLLLLLWLAIDVCHEIKVVYTCNRIIY